MNEADLSELMASIGASLGAAQGQMTAGSAIPTTRFAMSEATLELKVAVDQSSGKIRVATIAADAVSKGAIDPAALSTVTMRFVAFGADQIVEAKAEPTNAATDAVVPTDAVPITKPMTKAEAIKALADRPDVQAAAKVAGNLVFSAALQRARQSWLVTAMDEAGKMVGQTEVSRDKREIG